MPQPKLNPPVLMAEIAGPHGLKGEVKLVCYAENPDHLVDLAPLQDEKGNVYTLEYMNPHKAHYIAAFAEIADRTAAEKIKHRKLYIPRDRLPPLPDGEYYQTDLIGLTMVDTHHQILGEVMALQNFGAGELFHLKNDKAQEFFIPHTKDVILKIDLDAGLILADPPKGLLDDPKIKDTDDDGDEDQA
jgi:16S rRNA processing protein RimM